MMTAEQAYQELSGSTAEVYRELESTQSFLLARPPGPGTVAAAVQTAGRGRMERAWYSGPGGLWFSTSLPAGDLTAASLRAALACCRLLDGQLGLAAQIRWPNDVLVGGRKICGTLIDARSGFMIVGMGLNVDVQLPPELEGLATSIVPHFAPRPPLGPLLDELLSHLGRVFAENWADQRSEVERRCLPPGTAVTLWSDGRPHRSQIAGLGPDGCLLLADGTRHYSVERLETGPLPTE